jgi:hypothetical protein
LRRSDLYTLHLDWAAVVDVPQEPIPKVHTVYTLTRELAALPGGPCILLSIFLCERLVAHAETRCPALPVSSQCAGLPATVGTGTTDFNWSSADSTLFQSSWSFFVSIGTERSE